MKILVVKKDNKTETHIALETDSEFKQMFMMALFKLGDSETGYMLLKSAFLTNNEKLFTQLTKKLGCDCNYCEDLRKFIGALYLINKEHGFLTREIEKEKKQHEK